MKTTTKTIRIIVCGGRHYDDQKHVDHVLDMLWAEFPHQSLTIIHGCASGADACANAWAMAKRAKGYPISVERFPADWSRHGKAAGPIRNQEMVTHGKADLVAAFPGGRGTEDLCARAATAGIAVRRV